MEQHPVFGHRRAISSFPPDQGRSDEPRSLAEDDIFPLTLTKTLGVRLRPTLVALALLICAQLAPLLVAQPGAIAGVMFHSVQTVLIPAEILVAILIYALGHFPTVLTMDADGVFVNVRKKIGFIAWRDIDRAVETTSGVRLMLSYPLNQQLSDYAISGQIGLTPSQLHDVLAEGISRFSANASKPSNVTGLAPTTVSRPVRLMLACGLVFAMFCGFVIYIVMQGQTTLELQRHGRSVMAVPLRTYIASCGRRSCSTHVEYTFAAAGTDGAYRQYTGDSYISRTERDRLTAGSLIPVVYDARRPEVSQTNFNNVVFRSDPTETTWYMIKVLSVMFMLPVGLLALIAAPELLKALRRRRATSFHQQA